MKKLNDLVNWYINYKGFTKEEEDLLLGLREDTPVLADDESFKKLEQEYFDRMPYCNISTENRFIRFGESGTSLINQVFEKEVDDETMVITTRYEHNAVVDCLNKCKNVTKLVIEDLNQFNYKKIQDVCKDYKKVFVYIIGTQLMTGEITPQLFFIGLKELLEKTNKEYKIMIDDVHGMFLTPRDYSIFDYVLYTAHSLVCDYNMGCLISKDGSIGIKAYNWGVDYLKRLDIVLSRKDKLFMFKNILAQYFAELLADPRYCLLPGTTQHIFSIETTGIYFTKSMTSNLFEYRIKIDPENYYHNHIRIRFQEFCRQTPEDILKGIELLYNTLENLHTFYDNENYRRLKYE